MTKKKTTCICVMCILLYVINIYTILNLSMCNNKDLKRSFENWK